MAIARDASQDCASSSGSATNQSATFPATATADKFLLSGGAFGTDFAHVTPPSGWLQAFAADHNSGTFCLALYYKTAVGTETAAAWAVTSGATEMRVAAYQYSGVAAASPLDKTAVAQSGASAPTSFATGTTALTTVANELIVSAVHINGAGVNITWANGTELRDDQLFSIAQRIVAATGTYSDTASWTNNLNAVAGIATFKGAPDENTGWETC